MEKTHPLFKYVEMCEKRKPDLIKAIDWLDKNGFTTAPASSQHHLCEEGGLVKHSINVCDTLLKLRETLSPDISVESCVIVSLLHDCHKVCDPFGTQIYLPNMVKANKPKAGEVQEWKVSDKKPYVKNNKAVAMLEAYQSVMIAGRFITLTKDEAQAIVLHDGQYVYANREFAQKEYPLTLLLHYADMWSASVLEATPINYEMPDEG